MEGLLMSKTVTGLMPAVAGIAAALVLAGAALASTSPLLKLAVPYRHTFPATSSKWVNTHVSLAAGASVSFEVSGNASCGTPPDCPSGRVSGADVTCANRALGPLPPGPAGPNVDYGVMAGKVGRSGRPFQIGQLTHATGPGTLYLVYNDCGGGYSDNSGHFTVTVLPVFRRLPSPPTVRGSRPATPPFSTGPA
jgi:hypothetical protein